MKALLAAAAATVLLCGPVQAGVNCNERLCYASTTKNLHNGVSRYYPKGSSHTRKYAHKYVNHKYVRHNTETPTFTHAHGGLTQVCEGGHCGTVASSAAEKFQGLFRDLVAMGYNIGSPGCYSPTGHMRNSLHHWGGACDLFNQYARNRTLLHQPPPHVQIELAAKHGLTSGCSWGRSPDCGHFDLSGYTGYAYAMASRRHHIRLTRK